MYQQSFEIEREISNYVSEVNRVRESRAHHSTRQKPVGIVDLGMGQRPEHPSNLNGFRLGLGTPSRISRSTTRSSSSLEIPPENWYSLGEGNFRQFSSGVRPRWGDAQSSAFLQADRVTGPLNFQLSNRFPIHCSLSAMLT